MFRNNSGSYRYDCIHDRGADYFAAGKPLAILEPTATAMGRRKREFMSDDDSSENSAEDDYEERELHGEEQAERALFEDPYQQRKRRRLNKTGKDDATYGVFGEDDEEQPRYAPKRKAK